MKVCVTAYENSKEQILIYSFKPLSLPGKESIKSEIDATEKEDCKQLRSIFQSTTYVGDR